MWRAESLLLSITRYSGSTSASSNQLVWNDEWLQRHIEHACQTSQLLEKSKIGTQLITAQNVDSELENMKTMLATIKDDLPQGRLLTAIKCGDGTEVAWNELIALKNESYSTVSRELVIGARMDVMIAIQGVRKGTVAGGTLKIDTPYSHVGIADDLLFEGETAYHPTDILMTIDGVTRPASLKEAWDPTHLEAIEIDLASVKDKSISRLLTASRRHLCTRSAVASKSPYLTIDTNETPLDSYATMQTAQLGLDEIMVAQKKASVQLIAWCDTWQSRMKENPTDKVTLRNILTEAARRAPLFRRYKLFIICVTQLREMQTHAKNSAAKKSSTPSETKASFEMKGSDQNLIKLEDSVSAAMAMKDDAWLQNWLDRDEYGDFSGLVHDGTVAPLQQSNVDLFTRDFGTLTSKMSIPRIWRLLSEDQRQRIRMHFPIEKDTSTVTAKVGDEQHTVQPTVTRKVKRHGKKTKKQSTEIDSADDDRLIQEAIEEVKRERQSESSEKLYEAAEKGQCHFIPDLIKAGAAVDYAEGDNQTALMISSDKGHEQCVRVLIEAGAAVNAQDKAQWTALIYACRRGHKRVARLLLEAGADIEKPDYRGWTPLMWTVSNGHVQLSRILLEAGAVVSAQNNEGETALMGACICGHEQAARVLLEAGASINHRNENGSTALMFACRAGHDGVISTLIEAKANLNVQMNAGYSALMHAVRNGHDHIVRKLLKAGATVDEREVNGETASLIASKFGHEQCLRLLLVNGADPNTIDTNQWTALMYAVENGLEGCARALILAKADVEMQSKTGSTALMMACLKGHHHSALELLKAGAAVNVKNIAGQTALIMACGKGHLRCASVMIKANANVNVAADDGFTALIISSKYGREQCARVLIKAGATVDATEARGATSLLFASENGHLACTQLLIDAKADINHPMHLSQPDGGFTPLIAASNNGHDRVVQTLIEAGATINATDVNGFTALMLASLNGNIDCMRLLIKNGADPSQASRSGRTAIDLAQYHNQKRAEKLLELVSKGLAAYL